MHREGHIGIGLLVYAPIAAVLIYSEAALALGLGLVGIVFWSFAPDFDLYVPFVNHRGITHTFLAAGVAGTLSAAVGTWLLFAGIGTSPNSPVTLLDFALGAGFGFGIGVLGVISHLLGDVLTPMGIRPKQPFSEQKYVLGWVYAKNERANEFLWKAGAIAFIAAVACGVYVRENGFVSPVPSVHYFAKLRNGHMEWILGIFDVFIHLLVEL